MKISIDFFSLTKKALFVGLILLLTDALMILWAQAIQAATTDHVVISEVQTDGFVGNGGSADDFVELYNPTDTPVDLSTWSVQKTTGTGTSPAKVNLTGTIPAHGFYLVTRSDASQALLDLADDIGSSSFSVSNNNVVFLVSNQETISGADDIDIVDLVGLGSAQIFEGAGATANPPEEGSVERKSGEINNATAGNGYDTDDNLADFMSNDISDPQNSSSDPELPPGEEPGDGAGDESPADHIVISEIQTDGTAESGGTDDDFVELYNPTDTDINLTGYVLKRTTGTGTGMETIELSGTIPSTGYFLVVKDDPDTNQDLKNLADLLDGDLGITNNNVIWLEDDLGSTVDLVGFGTAETFEGTATAPNPGGGESIERMSGPVHEKNAGNGYDTDENSVDLFTQTSPNPQGSSSDPGDEPGDEPGDDPVKIISSKVRLIATGAKATAGAIAPAKPSVGKVVLPDVKSHIPNLKGWPKLPTVPKPVF